MDELYADEATATDNCGDFGIEMVVDSTSLDGSGLGEYTITRTFTVTDDAGISTTDVQVITVIDTTAPVFLYVPGNETVECSNQELLDELYADEATASDNCGDYAIEMVVDSNSVEDSGTGEYTITRTFTVTDDAGNNTVAEQTITVIDTTAPEFTYVPADETYQCSEFDAIAEAWRRTVLSTTVVRSQ